uniref:uncharacterized protein LOC120339760 isoform X1 n=1 Tax=Styela clava TaxID=7725 RepID=UPI00193983CA|nr:uncharacterized protein LOC120339760 isoform X1 [Styela clava]
MAKSSVSIVFLILISPSLLNLKAIQCKSSQYGVAEFIGLTDGRCLSCEENATTSNPPRPRKKDVTAIPPQDTYLSWYLTEGKNKRIALNITWSIRESHIPDQEHRHHFKGFYITVTHSSEYFALYTFKVKIYKNKCKRIQIGRTNLKDLQDIVFSYEHYGATISQIIRPNDIIQVTYDSIPLAKQNDTMKTKPEEIQIPDCRSEESLKFLEINSKDIISSECREAIKDIKQRLDDEIEQVKIEQDWMNQTTTNSTSLQSKENLYPYYMKLTHSLLVIFSIVFIITVITVCIKSEKKKRADRIEEPLSILLIADNSNDKNIKLSCKLIGKLRKKYGYKITCNLEEREIISKDATQWYITQMNTNDVIIFTAIQDKFTFDEVVQTGTNGHTGSNPLTTTNDFSEEFHIAKNYLFKNWEHVNKDCLVLVKKAEDKSFSKFRRKLRFYVYANLKQDDFYKMLSGCQKRKHKII